MIVPDDGYMRIWEKGMLSFLRHTSQNISLEFVLPIMAILIVLSYFVLQRIFAWNLCDKRWIMAARGFLLALLLAVAVLAVENYRATDYYRFDCYLNAYEFYHYYIGTKYAREVGYGEMYAASLVADQETGMKWKHKSGTIRDLSTMRQVNYKQVLANAEFYKRNFTPERWEEFKKDIGYFKNKLVQYRWDGVIKDKGYNGTPVWSMVVGGLFSNRISTESEYGMTFLALLDPILIFLTFWVVVWAFGLRAALLMIVLLGTHYMMKWWHMKGAYLRTDWAMCMVMAACCIKKQHFGIAGALTGYAMLSRIFPAVMLFGVGAKGFWHLVGLSVEEIKTYAERLELASRPRKARITLKATLIVFTIAFIWGTYGFINGVVAPWLAADDKSISHFFEFVKSGGGGNSVLMHLFTMAVWAAAGFFMLITGIRALFERRLDMRYVYFFVAFAIIVGSLTSLSFFYWRGTENTMRLAASAPEEQGALYKALPGYWQGYIDKIGRHNEDISTWRVGFKYIFMADFDDDFKFSEKPIKEWQPKVNPARYSAGKEVWWRIQIWVLLFTLFAASGVKDYRAYLLGFVPLFFLVAPTYYYYMMLLTPLLFFATRIDQGRYALGMCLMYITGMSGWVFYGLWQQNYGTYYWLSVQIMVMVLYMLFLGYIESIQYLIQRRGTASEISEA